MNRVKKFLLTTCVFASLAAVAIGVSACDTPQQEEHTHQWGNWTVATAPTDSAEGKATRTCSGEGTCDATAADKEYTLPALTGTDYSKDADSATCTTAGSVTYTYNKNGVSVSFDVTTSAKGHGTLEPHDAQAANCIENGYEAYWTCPDCEWLFSDAEGTNKIDAPVSVTARGSHGDIVKVEADMGLDGCSGSGTLEYYTCDDCGWLFSDAAGETRIDMPVSVSHQNAAKTDAVPTTCTDKGRAAYWTCPDCDKHFSDEDCTLEVTDLTSLDIDIIAHDIVFVEGEGATCDAEGYHDYYKCNGCHALYSDALGVYPIANILKIPKHPNAATDSGVATSKSASAMSFNAMTNVFCSDCGEYLFSTTNREVFDSDLLYYKRTGIGYWLFDKNKGEIATVNMPQATGGITFVAPETGIYTFTFGEGASISTVTYRQDTTDTTVYQAGWKEVAPAMYFDKTSEMLTNTLTFEVDKNGTVIVELSSGIFSASYTYEKSTKAYLNRAFTVVPTATDKTATIVADVPAEGEYLVTISNLSMYFNSTATFAVNAGVQVKTTTANLPVYITLSPMMSFTVTCEDTLRDTDEDGTVHYSYSYNVTITQIKGTLQMGDNSVNVTVANSSLDIDAYTFTAATAEDHTFTAPAGLTVKLPEKGVTIAAGSSGVVTLAADEKVIVVVSGAVNSYTLNISAGASYDPLPNTSTAIAFARQEVRTYSVPSDVVTAQGMYKITIVSGNMNYTPIAFGLNNPTDDYVTFVGPNTNAGTSDVIYGGFNQFYKKPAADSGITVTSQMATLTITLTLKPGDTLTFANGYNGNNNIKITVAAV